MARPPRTPGVTEATVTSPRRPEGHEVAPRTLVTPAKTPLTNLLSSCRKPRQRLSGIFRAAGRTRKIPDKRLTALSGMTAIAVVVAVPPPLAPLMNARFASLRVFEPLWFMQVRCSRRAGERQLVPPDERLWRDRGRLRPARVGGHGRRHRFGRRGPRATSSGAIRCRDCALRSTAALHPRARRASSACPAPHPLKAGGRGRGPGPGSRRAPAARRRPRWRRWRAGRRGWPGSRSGTCRPRA